MCSFLDKVFWNNLPTQPVGTSVIIRDNTLTWKLLDVQYELLIIIRGFDTICTHACDERVTIYQFSNARSQHYSLLQKWYKDALITGSIMEIIERNLTATLAWDGVVKTSGGSRIVFIHVQKKVEQKYGGRRVADMAWATCLILII